MKYYTISLFILIAGCEQHLAPVGLFIYREDDLFMKAFTSEILNGAGRNFPLTVNYGLNSQIIQNEQIEKSLLMGTPLLIVNPVDRLGAYALIRKAQSRSTPIIFFNRQPLGEDLMIWSNAWYIGAKADQSGELQAKLIMDLFGSDQGNLSEYDRNRDGSIQTIILKGQQGHQDTEIRTASVQNTLRKNGYSLDVLAIEIANWSQDEGYDRMDELLDLLSEPMEVVIANNDAMALGAIDALRQHGYFEDTNGNGKIDRNDQSWVPVVGIDGVPEAVWHIKNGYLLGTVFNDYKTMADAITTLSMAILDGGIDENFPYPVYDNRYIWIPYQTFALE